MTWNIPNILTVLRLLAAPGIAFAFLFLAHPWSDWVALVLFVGASLTDYLDGWIARRWGMESRFGAMLDPIADKAMVLIALMVVSVLFGMSLLVILPATLILFREVFVSGLREFLGSSAGLLKVTKLAKWKTTAQMVALTVLLANGLFAHYFGMGSFGMDRFTVDAILSGEMDDPNGLANTYLAMVWSYYAGVTLLWFAALLTVVTGADYLVKSLPYLREEQT